VKSHFSLSHELFYGTRIDVVTRHPRKMSGIVKYKYREIFWNFYEIYENFSIRKAVRKQHSWPF